jgi:copper(I)-binding protein
VKKSAAIAAILLASCGVSAPPRISVEAAWARATLPGQTSSAAYFTIRNAGGPDKLLSVSSSAANASLHSTATDKGVMRMRPVAQIDVPANSAVELKPGGTHVMMTGLKAPLTPGATIPLDLKFEKSGDRHVMAAVRPANGAGM